MKSILNSRICQGIRKKLLKQYIYFGRPYVFHSEARQDEFVANLLHFKEEGSCIDIGSCHSIFSNNTFFFDQLRWKSLTYEIDPTYSESYSSSRIYNQHHCCNVLDVSILQHIDTYICKRQIDYLSIDVDQTSYDVLTKCIPFGEVEFTVITIEHDYYLYGPRYRDMQRKFLLSKGYVLLFGDVLVEQSGYYFNRYSFEDWWINPKIIDPFIVDNLSGSSLYPSSIIELFHKTSK